MAWQVAGDGFEHGELQCRCSVLIEQTQQLGGDAGQAVAARGTLAALLGASPGASVSVQAMINVLERCFSAELNSEWQQKLKQLVPSYGESLIENAGLLKTVRQRVQKTLKLL